MSLAVFNCSAHSTVKAWGSEESEFLGIRNGAAGITHLVAENEQFGKWPDEGACSALHTVLGQGDEVTGIKRGDRIARQASWLLGTDRRQY